MTPTKHYVKIHLTAKNGRPVTCVVCPKDGRPMTAEHLQMLKPVLFTFDLSPMDLYMARMEEMALAVAASKRNQWKYSKGLYVLKLMVEDKLHGQRNRPYVISIFDQTGLSVDFEVFEELQSCPKQFKSSHSTPISSEQPMRGSEKTD